MMLSASEREGQARVVADRMIALFVERAVPAVRLGTMFETWALDEADRGTADHLLDGQSGAVRTCWDDAIAIYQAADAAICEVRADPVAPDHVVAQLDDWCRRTWPPFIQRPAGKDMISRDYIGPHPRSGFTNILVSFDSDPDDDTIYQAHLSVAWIAEDGA